MDVTISRPPLAMLLAVAVVLEVAGQRAAADEPAPQYAEHQDLGHYLDGMGTRHEIKTIADWETRRKQVIVNMQRVMGPLPDRTNLAPMETRELEVVKVGEVVRRKIEYTTEPGYRLRAYLLIPARAGAGKVPAVLCLHQT